MKHVIAIAIVVAWRVAYAGPSAPATDEGKRLFAEGSAAVERGDLAGAAAAFEAGYRAEPWPVFLFARAQVVRELGDCALAVKLYSQYLDSGPPPEASGKAQKWIGICGGRYTPPVKVVTVVEEKKPPPKKPPYPHKLAVGLAVGAAATGLTSGALYGLARWHGGAAAHDEPIYPDAIRRYELALRYTTAARIGAAVTAGLAVAALVRYQRQRRSAHVRVGVGVALNAVVIGGDF